VAPKPGKGEAAGAEGWPNPVPKADGAAAGWEPNAKVPLEVKLLVSEPKPPLPNALGAALVAPNGLLNGAGVLKDCAGAEPNTEAAGLNALSPPKIMTDRAIT
jgi:hypothetical protein